MNKIKMEKSNYLQIMLIGFVALIFGCVVISTLADQTQSTTVLVNHNDTINLAADGYKNATFFVNQTKNYTLAYPATAQWRKDTAGCASPTLVVSFANGTNQLLTANTHYAYDAVRSQVTFKNVEPINSTGIGANLTYLAYTQCPDSYMTESWTRTVYNMVPGFFALGVLGVALFVAQKLLAYMQANE